MYDNSSFHEPILENKKYKSDMSHGFNAAFFTGTFDKSH